MFEIPFHISPIRNTETRWVAILPKLYTNIIAKGETHLVISRDQGIIEPVGYMAILEIQKVDPSQVTPEEWQKAGFLDETQCAIFYQKFLGTEEVVIVEFEKREQNDIN